MAVVDGLSPFTAALIVLVPLFIARYTADINWAYFSSLGLALIILFCLGLFLGHVSRGKLIIYGFKTILAGIESIAISFLLGVST